MKTRGQIFTPRGCLKLRKPRCMLDGVCGPEKIAKALQSVGANDAALMFKGSNPFGDLCRPLIISPGRLKVRVEQFSPEEEVWECVCRRIILSTQQ